MGVGLEVGVLLACVVKVGAVDVPPELILGLVVEVGLLPESP